MMEVLGGEASAYAKHLKESMGTMHAEKNGGLDTHPDTLSEMNQRIKNGDVPEAESLRELRVAHQSSCLPCVGPRKTNHC